MVTKPLDLDDLLTAVDGRKWTSVPNASVIGHVHVQVGALAAAEAFYAGLLGLDVTNHSQGALFFAADGYHHHIATNIWNSGGAGERTFPQPDSPKCKSDSMPPALPRSVHAPGCRQAIRGRLR